MLLINASQCKEHMVKVPSYKDIAIEDMLIEDAANVDQLGILKVGSQWWKFVWRAPMGRLSRNPKGIDGDQAILRSMLDWFVGFNKDRY